MNEDKLAIVAMVKNEADIIEPWARANLRHASRLFVADNGSGDATVQILGNLIEEGLP